MYRTFNAKFQIKMCRNEDFGVTFIRGTLDVITEGVDFSKIYLQRAENSRNQ